MATLIINNFTLEPLNPDGTTNALLPTISGSLPPTEAVDFASMGQRFKLTLECEIAGTYSDSSTADVAGTYVRYNPAMFVDPYTKYPFVGSFPTAGYLIQIPSTTAGTYNMPLSFVSGGEFSSSNENGSVTIEVTSATEFTITHSFTITADVEGYLSGKNISNQRRLSRNSIYNAEEWQNDRPTVFGTQKAFNAIVAIKQRGYTTIADELSLLFKASFYGNDSDGDAILASTVSLERTGTVDSLSTFEDTTVTIEWEDPDAKIQVDSVEVILTLRQEQGNIAGFEKDLNIQRAKLETTVSTGTISGPFKGPVSYVQSGGITSVSFVVDKTQLELAKDYDLHFIAGYQSDVSEFKTIHGALRTTTLDFDSLAVNMDFQSEFYSRNNNHAEHFTATVMERISNVLVMDSNDYNSNASPPYTQFWNDLSYVRFELKDSNDNLLYAGNIIKNTSTLELESNEQIEVSTDPSSGLVYLTANNIRIPYANFQGLDNMGVEATNEYTWTWKARFIGSADDRFESEFQYQNILTIRPYENNEAEPSEAPKVSNIRFVDPDTGRPLSNWCETTSVLVLADAEDLGSDTLVTVYIDRYPYGATFEQDYALEEMDSTDHTQTEPVVIPQMTTDLVSNLTASPESGTISFLLDVSTLNGDEINRVSIMIYRANP